jgi:poly(A) polymerase
MGIIRGAMHSRSENSTLHPEPTIVPRSEHSLSRSSIDPDALKVLYRLNRHGHIAYLVGGGVRDLLLGKKPKDFDISTSAHPHEIKKIFGNCRLIGRRFRLAHIYFKGGKIIEVSTFRAISEINGEDGPVTSDNTFGTPWEDAFRRDFTVNALFYNVSDFSVIDYVNGLKDLENRLIRCIGDPEVRFREDPIRMLRGIRFAALLDCDLDSESERLIRESNDDIWEGATPRILEEIIRMMGRGTAASAFDRLQILGLLSTLFPEIDQHIRIEGSDSYRDVFSKLDKRFLSGEAPDPWLIFACLFYPYFDFIYRGSSSDDLLKLARDAISPVCRRIQVPKRMQDIIRQILAAQVRLFELRSSRFKPRTILRKSYFRDAFTLFEIVASTTSGGQELINEWKKLEGPSPSQRPDPKRTRRRRKRGPKPPATTPAG